MAKQSKIPLGLAPETVVEVVMKKKMTVSEYLKIKSNTKSRDWKIQAYQEGAFSDGMGKEIE
ncbi:hypothetical protein [Flavobacterium sp. HSC-61S13]|uniref:hypothetical protein n=1 Tax=unclassified Flavobacterium TaxID=196869 RepID=UPI0020A0AFE3|nr:hypothetical protein [Flavobacterium sp. HSC-61S13]MCP1996676.1 hypothetical protein [Flavobacterium sp. HSC-61S13]